MTTRTRERNPATECIQRSAGLVYSEGNFGIVETASGARVVARKCDGEPRPVGLIGQTFNQRDLLP